VIPRERHLLGNREVVLLGIVPIDQVNSLGDLARLDLYRDAVAHQAVDRLLVAVETTRWLRGAPLVRRVLRAKCGHLRGTVQRPVDRIRPKGPSRNRMAQLFREGPKPANTAIGSAAVKGRRMSAESPGPRESLRIESTEPIRYR
jgi:hypothetical protein